MKEKDFRTLFKEARETGVVEVKLGKETYPALIHNVQRDPVSGKMVHIDFHKVNLKEKITSHVPVKLVSQSPAEKSGVGLILQTINELEIESLPGDIPPQVEVDTSKLEEVGQTIHVKDLKIDREKAEVKNEAEDVVVSVQTAEMKEEPVEEEAPAPEEVEAIAEKGEEEEAGEGEKKPDEGKKEEQPQPVNEQKPPEEAPQSKEKTSQ
jgi:large subunit ribosomal protein L25